MPQLQTLRADHGPVLLDFELANRAYFAASMSDRGDDYYEHLTQRHQELLTEQHAGLAAYHVLVANDGSIVGRFNLRFLGERSAELGYRVAERAARQGLATRTVRELCDLARAR